MLLAAAAEAALLADAGADAEAAAVVDCADTTLGPIAMMKPAPRPASVLILALENGDGMALSFRCMTPLLSIVTLALGIG